MYMIKLFSTAIHMLKSLSFWNILIIISCHMACNWILHYVEVRMHIAIQETKGNGDGNILYKLSNSSWFYSVFWNELWDFMILL